MAPRVIPVAVATLRAGRCKFCGAAILWANTASRPGKPSRPLPFTAPRPAFVPRARNEATGVTFEQWPIQALHVVTCRGQAPRRTIGASR